MNRFAHWLSNVPGWVALAVALVVVGLAGLVAAEIAAPCGEACLP